MAEEMLEEVYTGDPKPKPGLADEHRAKLDSIVQRMISNKESDDNIRAVVNDFKTKYSQQAAPASQPRPAQEPFKPVTDWLNVQQPGYTPMSPGNVVNEHTKKTAESSERVKIHLSDIDNSVKNLIYEKKKDVLGREKSQELGLNPRESGPVNFQAQQLELNNRRDVYVSPVEVEGFKEGMNQNPVMKRQGLAQKAKDLTKTDPAQAALLKADVYRLDRQDDPGKDKKVSANIEKINKGEYDYDITTGTLQKPVGFFGGIIEGFKQKGKTFDEYSIYSSGNEPDILKYLNKKIAGDPDEPTVVGKEGFANVLPGGEAGMMTGGQPLKPLAGGAIAGALAGPEAGAAAMGLISAPEMYKLGYANALPQNYAAIKKQHPEMADVDAYHQASELAEKQANIDAATGMAMGLLGGEFAFKPTGLSTGLLQKSIGSALKQVGEAGAKKTLEGLGVGAMGATGQVIKNLMGQSAGLPVDETEGVAEQLKGGVAMTIGMTLAAKASGLLKPSTYNKLYQGLSKIPPEAIGRELDNLQKTGHITPEEAQKVQEAIDAHKAIDQSIKPNVPESDRLEVHELIKKRNELEASLKTEDKAYHAETKDKIVALNEKIFNVSKGSDRGELQKLIDKSKIGGSTKEYLQGLSEKELKGEAFKEIAEQAHDPLSENQAIETFGEDIVNKAKELYPKAVEPETLNINTEEIPATIEGEENIQRTPEPVEVAGPEIGGQPIESGGATGQQEMGSPKEIGITHRQMNAIAEELGLPSYEGSPEKVAEWDQQAAAKLQEPGAVNDLFTKLRDGTPPDHVETRMMLQYMGDLMGKIDKNPYDRALQDQVLRTKDLFNIAGRIQGKALVARKGSITAEDTLSDFIMRDREANKAPLTDEQITVSKKEYEEFNKARDAWIEKAANDKEKAIKQKAEKEIKKIASEAKKQTGKDYSSERKQIINNIKEKWGGDKKLDSIEHGVNNDASRNSVDEYVRKANAVLKKFFPEIEVAAYEKSSEYQAKEKRPSGSRGVFDALNRRIAFNMEDIRKANSGKTIFHEIIHPIINEVIAKDESKLGSLYSKLYEIKDAPGMDQVWAHENKYRGRGIDIVKSEAITEFMALVADGKINTDILSKSVVEKVIDLINKVLEAINVDKRISGVDDLKSLALSIKAALQEEDTSKLETVLKDRKEGGIIESFDSIHNGKSYSGIAPDVMKLVKNIVDEGVSKLPDVIKSVHETIKEVIPEITEKDVHDIIAGEYNEKKPTRNKLAQQLYDLRTEAGLVNKLHDLETGKQPKSQKQIIKRNQAIEALRTKIKDFEKSVSEANATEKRIKTLEDELARVEERRPRVNTEKETKEITQKEQDLKNKIEAEKKAWAEEIKKPPEERALQALKARYKKQISDTEGKIAAGDYGPDVKPEPIVLDKEATDLKDKMIKLKLDREARLAKQEYEARTKYEKGKDLVADALDATRTVQTNPDLSFFGRQGIKYLLTHPAKGPQVFWESVRQAGSQKRYDRWLYDMHNSAAWKLLEDSGLAVLDPNTLHASKREEQWRSQLIHKIPGVKQIVKSSERAFTSGANMARVDWFMEGADILRSQGKTFENSPEEYKGWASAVNNMTGRGGLGALEPVVGQLAVPFWSPRLIASNVNLFLNPVYYARMPKMARMMLIDNMAQYITTAGAFLGLASVLGADVETDPRSSDFGKIKVGNTRYDIWGGASQYIRVVSQLLTESRKSNGGLSDLSPRQMITTGSNLARTKLSPLIGFGVDAKLGTNVVGEKVEWKDAYKLMIPMLWNDIQDAKKDSGPKGAAVAGMLSFLGIGAQTYGGKSGGGTSSTTTTRKPSQNKPTKQSKPHKIQK